MRIWCAQCRRVQDVLERRRRPRSLTESFGGPIGVCAVCGYPVSVIGPASRPATRALVTRPLIGRAFRPAARTMAEQPLAVAS
jgi:hypothetical protein